MTVWCGTVGTKAYLTKLRLPTHHNSTGKVPRHAGSISKSQLPGINVLGCHTQVILTVFLAIVLQPNCNMRAKFKQAIS